VRWLTGLLVSLVAAAPAAAADGPVLGKPGLFPGGAGWGTAKPRSIFNGGSPGGLARDIRWRNWGAATATGAGRMAVNRLGGTGYYSRLVRVEFRAKRLGRCGDRRAYTRLIARAQEKPGGRFRPWHPWTLDLCDWHAEPAPCDPVEFTPGSGEGAREVAAWDTDCATARQVATASGAVPLDPSRSVDGIARYRFQSRGFTCHGYSYASGDHAEILWSCLRDTAVVRMASNATRSHAPAGPCVEKVVSGVAEARSACFRIAGRVARSTDPVRVNGIDLSGAEVTIDLRRKRLTTRRPVELRLGWLALGRRALDIDLARPSKFKVETAKADLAGMKLDGSAELRLEPGRTIAGVSVQLPKFVKAKARHRAAPERPTIEIAMQADNDVGLRPETIGANWPLLRLPGKFELSDVSIKYVGTVDAATGTVKHGLEGSGTLWLSGVNPKGIEARVKIGGPGGFEVAAAAENLNKPLWRVVYLQKLGFSYVDDPFTLGAAAGLTAGPQIKLPAREPFRVMRLDGDLTFANDKPPTWKVTGKGDFIEADFDGELKVATTGKTDLEGEIAYAPPLAPRYGLRGRVEGWLEGGEPAPSEGGGGGSWGDGAALLQGRVRMSMPGVDVGSAEAVLSTQGVAACRRGVGPDVGFGATWGGDVDVMAKSCGLGPWAPDRPSASAAQATPLQVRVGRGERVLALRVAGTGGAPVVTVTGPRGVRVDTLAPPADAVVVRDDERSATYVALDRPARGTYTITPAAGSPPVAGLSSARALPRVRVRARVRGHGKRRVLRYRIHDRAGARVHFVEQGDGVRRVIGTAARRRGTVRFRPAKGPAGRRRIVAVVVRGGFVQDTRTVARYRR
jgi:hypothetical protein